MALTALHRFGPEDMNPGEEVIYRAHLSFVGFMTRAKGGIFIFLLGMGLLVLAFIYRDTIGFWQDTTITLGVSIFVGAPLIYGLYRFKVFFIDWLYDEDIITNQRVIDYNQKFLFARDVSTANMKSVENVILDQAGLLRTFFNYGSLEVQTAASARGATTTKLGKYLILEDVKHPKEVQRLIDEIAHRVKNDIRIDREEMLIMCGLKEGDLDEYFVIRKTRGWKQRIKKLIRLEDV